MVPRLAPDRHSLETVRVSTAAPVLLERPGRRARITAYATTGAYAALVTAVILRHEPWADEAQAWLLARDASLPELWTRLLHYEGSPGVWQTLLHFFVGLGFPYQAYNFLSGALGLWAAWLLVRRAPFALPARILLPFTYYISYQYSVISRSYSLMAPLLFLCAATYDKVFLNPFLCTALLCLMAGISVHGVIVSACIFLSLAVRGISEWAGLSAGQRRRVLVACGIYGVVVLLFMLAAWPASDVAFAEHRGIDNLSFLRLTDVAQTMLAEAFTGEWITSLTVVLLSLPFLWRGGGWLVFLAAGSILWLFGTVVYSHVWHYGIVLLTWLFALWISSFRVRLTRSAAIALAVVIAVQGYWTLRAMRYDWRHPYSGGGEVAAYLRDTPIPRQDLYAVGYATTAVQPYFPSNRYGNFQHGAAKSYWDWSKGNTVNDRSALLSSLHRKFVLVGYKAESERVGWERLLLTLGYRKSRHFGGDLFWHTRMLEPESFDLYTHDPNADSTAESEVSMADPSIENQLVNGFYGEEQQSWRWTARKFSVVLRTPPGAARTGAHLVMQLYIPETQIGRLGVLSLSADVDGHPLGEQFFGEPGPYQYAFDVPPEALGARLVAVNFRFNKAAKGNGRDARELGAVVSSIALQPN